MRFNVRITGDELRLLSDPVEWDDAATEGQHDHYKKATELAEMHSTITMKDIKQLAELVNFAKDKAEKGGWQSWNERIMEVCQPIVEKFNKVR